jgi:hypothetical protein
LVLDNGVVHALANDSITLTFVGTGLDIFNSRTVSDSSNYTILVDGNVILSNGPLNAGSQRFVKLVSGLPYGTHTVQILYISGAAAIAISDFIVYGPKKPSIPDGAVEVCEYYLMADFDASTAAGELAADAFQTPRGSLFKANTREWLYLGGGWTTSLDASSVNSLAGFVFFTTTATQSSELTFFGDSVVAVLQESTASVTFSVEIDGALNASGVVRGNVTNGGGGSYTAAGTANNEPVRIEFSGLGLGQHTIKITKTAGTGGLEITGAFIDSKIHFPNDKAGSLSVGPAIKLQKETSQSGIDLSKAKAWVLFDAFNNRIEDSYNISSVLSISAAVKDIFFEKPFKTNKYIAVSSINLFGGNAGVSGIRIDTQRSNMVEIITYNVSGAQVTGSFCLAFYGELADEEESE